MPPTDRFIGKTQLRVRYAEVDSMRIVHHSRYIVYFEEGRSAYARQRGKPYSQFEADGFYLAVTEVNVRYIQPAHYEQLITIKAWITDMKSRGLTFAYEILDADTEAKLVTGFTKHICVDQAGKVARIPESWREWSAD